MKILFTLSATAVLANRHKRQNTVINNIVDAWNEMVTFTNATGHGCQCWNLLSDAPVPGKPVDDLDRVCLDWNNAIKCQRKLGGVCGKMSEQDLPSYTNYEDCDDNIDACPVALCKINKEFAGRVNAFGSSGWKVDPIEGEDRDTRCRREKAGPLFDSCCYVDLFSSIRYDSTVEVCENGEVSNISVSVSNPIQGNATVPDEQYLTLRNENGESIYARYVTIDGDDAIYTTGHRWGNQDSDFPIAEYYKLIRRNMNDGTLVYDRPLVPALRNRQRDTFAFHTNHKATLRFGNFLLVGGYKNNLDVYDIRNGNHVSRFESGIPGNALDDTTTLGSAVGFGRDAIASSTSGMNLNDFVPAEYANWRVYHESDNNYVNSLTADDEHIYVQFRESGKIEKLSISDAGVLTEVTNTGVRDNLQYPWTNGNVNSCVGGSYYAYEIGRGNSYTGIDVYNSEDMTLVVNIPYASALYERYGGGLKEFENSAVFSDIPADQKPDFSTCIRSDLSTMKIWQERYLVLVFVQDCTNVPSRGLMMILDLDNGAKVLRWDVIMDVHNKHRSNAVLDGNFLIMNGCDLESENVGRDLERSGFCYRKRTIVTYDVSKFLNGDADFKVSSISSDDFGWNTNDFKFFDYGNGHLVFGNTQSRSHVFHVELVV